MPTTPNTPNPPAKKRRRRIFLILGAVVLLFACAIIASLFRDPAPDEPADLADQPAPTDAPAATAVPQPTDAPAPAPTTPADPVEALRAAIDTALGESNRDLGRKLTTFDVRPDERTISVGWAADDNFSTGLIRSGLQLDTVAILKAIDAGNVPYDWVFLGATFALQDQSGNASEADVLTLAYKAATLDGINWDNFNRANVFDIADTFVLRPALQGD